MNAPTFWQQVLIAVLAIFLMPTVIAILAKLHILPITVYLLIADSFPGLIEDHRKLCNILIAVFIAYPALIWGRKLLQLGGKSGTQENICLLRPYRLSLNWICRGHRTIGHTLTMIWIGDEKAGVCPPFLMRRTSLWKADWHP